MHLPIKLFYKSWVYYYCKDYIMIFRKKKNYNKELTKALVLNQQIMLIINEVNFVSKLSIKEDWLNELRRVYKDIFF